jgi:ABC-type transport system involved in multi-copper enzyme maturation permease subunit
MMCAERKISVSRVSQTWAVARYELTWDLRKRRTYFILGVLLLSALYFGYLVPSIGGRWTTLPPFNSGASFESSLWWVNGVNVAFNALASGLFPLLIGGFIAADSLATEFDTNTIVPLLSQPVTRLEVYGGKFLEKFLLLLFASALFTLMILIASEASIGAQAQLDAFPLVVFFEFGAILQYAALAFFVGSLVRSGSMVLGILTGLLFGTYGTVLVLGLQFGLQEPMSLLPLVNAAFLLRVMPYSVIQPSGSMVLQGAILGNWTPQVTVTVISAVEYVVAGLAINLAAAFTGGFYFFRKAEIKG